jgi:ABC-type multidrug transport system ATPase subunit
MSEHPVVETDALGKRYGSMWALRDCSLSIPAGSVVALVGPNGAGKTTLLHLLVGLNKPTVGDARSSAGRLVSRQASSFRGSASSRRTIRSTAGSRSPRR